MMRRCWKDVDYKHSGDKKAERGERTRTNMVSEMVGSNERTRREVMPRIISTRSDLQALGAYMDINGPRLNLLLQQHQAMSKHCEPCTRSGEDKVSDNKDKEDRVGNTSDKRASTEKLIARFIQTKWTKSGGSEST